jgi:hypothetical protein
LAPPPSSGTTPLTKKRDFENLKSHAPYTLHLHIKRGVDVKDSKWMTMAEACLHVDGSRRTVVRMVGAGRLPASHRFYNHRQQYFNRAEFLKAWDLGLK